MTKSAILAGAKVAARLTDTRPRLMFFESHAHQKVISLFAESVKKMITTFGITDALFEMPETTKPQDVRKILSEDDKKTYEGLCEHSEIFHDLMKFSNKKFGTKFDPDEMTRKNISRCIQGLSFDDCTQIIRSTSTRKLAEVQILSLAHVLKSIGNGYEDRALISERVVEALGANHCHHVDIEIADLTSSKAMAKRNESIAAGIVTYPSSIGFFGAAHYRTEDRSGAVDYIEKFHRQITSASNPLLKNIPPSDIPRISPAELICIHPYSGLPLDEADVARRTTKPAGNFPIYVFDATKLSSDDFVLQVGKIVDQHREKFSGLGVDGR